MAVRYGCGFALSLSLSLSHSLPCLVLLGLGSRGIWGRIYVHVDCLPVCLSNPERKTGRTERSSLVGMDALLEVSVVGT